MSDLNNMNSGTEHPQQGPTLAPDVSTTKEQMGAELRNATNNVQLTNEIKEYIGNIQDITSELSKSANDLIEIYNKFKQNKKVPDLNQEAKNLLSTNKFLQDFMTKKSIEDPSFALAEFEKIMKDTKSDGTSSHPELLYIENKSIRNELIMAFSTLLYPFNRIFKQ